jgi:NADPH:quinone reductase
MRAFTLNGFGAPPALSDIPPPAPGDDEVLIRAEASSVNPVDNAIAAGMLEGMFEHEFPVVLGRDFAGVVEQGGPRATRFPPGERVFGFVLHAGPVVRDGAWAERITVSETTLAAVPAAVDLAAAGAAPLAGITALFAVDAVDLAPGQTVLIVGASGGVGSFAVQLASHAGAQVLASALPEDAEYLRDLGAAEVVDRNTDVTAAARSNHPDGVDALIDLVSYTDDAFEAYAAALKDDGRAASPLSGIQQGPGRAPIMAVPDPSALERLAELVAGGTLRVPIQRSYRLEQASDALAALSASHTQGKIAMAID